MKDQSATQQPAQRLTTLLIACAEEGSASPYRLREDIIVLAVVVAELELGNVQRQILFAHVVECADDPALQDAPETFNGLSVNRANNVLVDRVINVLMRIFAIELVVADPLIGAEQADLGRDSLANELSERRGADILDNASNHVAFAADCADHGRLAGADAASPAAAAPLVPMPVLGLPPMKVSSTSTMPPSLVSGSIMAERILWPISQAVLTEPKPM
jgi:hypothetical protein